MSTLRHHPHQTADAADNDDDDDDDVPPVYTDSLLQQIGW